MRLTTLTLAVLAAAAGCGAARQQIPDKIPDMPGWEQGAVDNGDGTKTFTKCVVHDTIPGAEEWFWRKYGELGVEYQLVDTFIKTADQYLPPSLRGWRYTRACFKFRDRREGE